MMKFPDAYLRPATRYTFRLLWLIAAFISVSAFIGFQAYREYDAVERLTAINDRLRTAQAASRPPKVDHSTLDMEKRWSELQLERDLPWEHVFQAVERANKTDIELLEFQPDKRNRIILLRGEARHQKALISYIEALAAQPVLVQVHLLHQQGLARDKLETIGFEIKANIR